MAAIAQSHLSFAQLRRRFQADPPWQPEVRDDRARSDSDAIRDAAVLIPLVTDDQGEKVILTTRPATLSSHSGQISFPGGGVDADDANRYATALREAQEEIDLDPAQVEVIGHLPEYITNSGFSVTPVVGLIAGTPALKANPTEVDEIFQVPLSFLMDPENHERRQFNWQGEARTFYSMPWTNPDDSVEYFIWGVTAAIIRNLYHCLSAKY